MSRARLAFVLLLSGCFDFGGLGRLYAPDGSPVGGGGEGDEDLAAPDADLATPPDPPPDLSPPPPDLVIRGPIDLGPPDLSSIPTASGFSSHSSPTSAPLLSVAGTGPNDVWIAGQSIILHSSGGAFSSAWSGSASLAGVWAATPNQVWAVGAGGTILRLNNGGNWKNDPSGTNNDLHAVWGTSASNVWVAGSGVILHSTGNSWSVEWSDGNAQVNSVHGCAADDVWAAGIYSTATSSNGLFLHRDANGWTTETTTTSEILQAIVCEPGNVAHAVGGALGTPGPRVYRHDWTGWTAGTISGDGALFALWAGPAGELYTAGYGGAIWRQLPGGTWTALGSPTSNALWGLWGSSSADVYAVGDSGTILHLP
jgi:hypothetical protein